VGSQCKRAAENFTVIAYITLYPRREAERSQNPIYQNDLAMNIAADVIGGKHVVF
jgi:hypothetical protein